MLISLRGKNEGYIFMDKITKYLTIKEAAGFLGVSPSTLRNWERQGKLSTHRNPVNSTVSTARKIWSDY